MYLKSAALLLISSLLLDRADANLAADCSQLYAIQNTDVCFEFWLKFGVTEAQWFYLNPDFDCKVFKVTEVVCLWADSLGPMPTEQRSLLKATMIKTEKPDFVRTPKLPGGPSTTFLAEAKKGKRGFVTWPAEAGKGAGPMPAETATPTRVKLAARAKKPKTKANVCRSYTDNFKDAKRIVSEERYNGNPKSADWIDISGDKRTWHLGPDGLEMRVLSPGKVQTSNGRNNKVGQGATLNSTYELNFGSVEFKVKMSPVPGIVTATITMSDGNDEIDWEWVGGDLKRAQSNYYYKGIADYSKGRTHDIMQAGHPVDNSKDWSIFRLELQPDYIRWYINGVLVRNLDRNTTASGGVFHFPSQKTRVQIGIWDSSDNAETAHWARGPVAWNSLGKYVSAYIEYIKIECDPRHNKVIS